MSRARLPQAEIAPGKWVPRLINGCWQLASDHRDHDLTSEQSLAALFELAALGLTTFDCADIYTGVEERLGALGRRWLVAGRKEPLRIHTKFVPDLDVLPTIDRNDVEQIVGRSRKRLGGGPLHLVQFHWWDFAVDGWIATARWLDELRRAGWMEHLGVTNFDREHLQALLDAGVEVVSNQVQYSLLDRRPAHGTDDFCQQQGIGLLTYGALAGGFLTDRWLNQPDPGSQVSNRSLTKYRLIIEEFGGWGDFQHLLGSLHTIAQKHGVAIANVATRWVLDRPGVTAVVLGTAHARHGQNNLRTFAFTLDREDLEQITLQLRHRPGPAGDIYSVERIPGGRHGAIMKTHLNSTSRLQHITKIGVEQMGELADQLRDPEVLRLENLDTDLRPPQPALEFTKKAVDDDAANSYLPFLGLDCMRQAAARLVGRQAGYAVDWKTECIISAGGLCGIFNVLLATIEPGDQVLMTDPTYVGLINRVRLAGGVPRFVPLIPSSAGWRLDTDALARIDPKTIQAALLMSPSMPTGAVFNDQEWHALIDFCQRAECWLLNDAAMERILFDQRPVIHPASFATLRQRVVTIGSASKEYRMIGWRVGWVVGPAQILADVARVSLSNVVCQTGIAMGAVAAAIEASDDGIQSCVEEWQRRRDLLLDELRDFNVIPPHGGWSFLVDVSALGFDGPSASKRLLEVAKIAATPMVNWGGADSRKYLRIVFSNEPLARLRGVGQRFRDALT